MADDPIELTPNVIAAIGREMAIAIKPPAEILTTFKLTVEQFERDVQQLAFYKQCYNAFVIEWESAISTNKRIALQAGAALEQILPRIAGRAVSRTESLPAVTETAKLLAKLSGAGEERRTEISSEKFKIIINLGADKQVFDETVVKPVIDITPVPALKGPG